MAYQPKYLTPDQIGQESGGKQFDKSGKPLTSRKGAIGIAQVMPDTGPEAARLAGLPWDENRYRTDRDYNLQLGDAYMGAKLREFGGDRVKAKAAYNTGAGNVRRALKAALNEGGDWRDHLHPETQEYIGWSSGKQGHAPTGKGIQVAYNDPNPKDGPASNEMSGANPFRGSRSDTPVMNPFQAAGEATARISEVQDRTNVFQRMVGEQSEALDNLQEERRMELEATVNAKRGIIDQQITDTQGLIAAAAPVLEAKAKVDNQLAKVHQMNPLVKGIRGIFDLNYNEKYLAEQQAGLQNDLEAQAGRFKYQTTLRDSYVAALQANFENNDSLRNLTLKDMDEDSKMMGQSLIAAEKNFELIGTALSANAQIIQTQKLASSQFLDRLTPQDHAALLDKAMQSPTHMVEVNGMQVGAGELRERIQKSTSLTMSLKSQAMALAAGEMEFADKNQENIIQNMTESQVKEATSNGGVFQGVQLDPNKLNQRLVGFNNLRLQEAQGIASADVNNQIGTLTRQVWHGIRTGMDRYINLVGGEQSWKLKTQFANKIVALSNKWQEFQKSGVGPEGAQMIAGELQQLQKDFQSQVNTTAKRFSGGDASTESAMKAYLTGGELSTDEATGAVYSFVDKGTMPAGLRRSPVFNAMYNFMKFQRNEVVKAHQGKAVGKDQLRRETMDRVMADNGNAANQYVFKEIMMTAPQYAAQIKAPAGKIDPEAWKVAWEAGSKEFQNQIAAKASRQEAMSARYTAIFETLDQLAGSGASESMMKFLESPEFIKHTQEYSDHQKGFGLGDYMANAMSVGTLGTMAAGNVNLMGKVFRERLVDQAVSNNKSRYHVLPIQRVRMLVGGIPGVSEPDEKALVAALQHELPGLNEYGDYTNQVAAARNLIVSGKFHDPNLERIRKTAAKEWDSTDQMLERAMNR